MTDIPVNAKRIAAERAVSFITDGMRVGLGTGSTTAYAIAALGTRIHAEHLSLTCIPTSEASALLAAQHGIALSEWTDGTHFDIVLDGADEVDPQFNLIKGGGGALVREKLVAIATTREVIIVDGSKMVNALGTFPLPVAVVPFAWQGTRERLEAQWKVPVTRRARADGEPFLSDDGLFVLDMAFGRPFPLPPAEMEHTLVTVPGVVDAGIFVGLCHHVFIGYSDGRVEERLPS